jgi:hypothetical protein
MANRAVRKILSYRDQSGASQEAHVAHWLGFRWQTGPIVVSSHGSWGTVRVLAATEAEGKRVIRHAAAIGGWDPDDPAQGTWQVQTIGSSRYGKAAEVGVKIRRGVPWVSKRNGPSGAPEA